MQYSDILIFCFLQCDVFRLKFYVNNKQYDSMFQLEMYHTLEVEIILLYCLTELQISFHNLV